MTNKEKYHIFCGYPNVYVPVFSQPWWLDAACGAKNWDVLIVEKGGIYVAALPYYLEIREGRKRITKAKNTQNNGIIISYPEKQKYTTRLDYEEKIINELIDNIEGLGLDQYEQQYHYSFQNWLPFYWRGYDEITRYTYVIEDTSDMNVVMDHYTSNVRKNIKKASKIVHLRKEELSVREFYEINKMSFERQGKDIPYSYEYVQNIYEAGCKNNAACILAAEDEKNNTHSAVLLIWDKESIYYLLNGTNPEYKNSQANCYLIHESICLASKMYKKFDFEGSVIRQIEKAFREYGGIRMPYFRISKAFTRSNPEEERTIG